MPLPMFTNIQSQDTTSWEPIHPLLYEVIIEQDDEDECESVVLLIDNIRNFSYVNERIFISTNEYTDDNTEYISKYFRNHKLNLLLGDNNKEFYKIIMSKYGKIGDVIERIEFIGVKFIGCSNEGFHFDYKSLIEAKFK